MTWKTARLVLPIALIAALAGVSADDDAKLEARAQRLEGLIMAPCCAANTVAVHESPAATEARREIRQLLSEGKSNDEVLDYFVARHGEVILAAPRPEGFHLLPYVAPGVFFLIGAVFVWVTLRRWKAIARSKSDADAEAPVPSTSEIDPHYRRRLEEELRRQGG